MFAGRARIVDEHFEGGSEFVKHAVMAKARRMRVLKDMVSFAIGRKSNNSIRNVCRGYM